MPKKTKPKKSTRRIAWGVSLSDRERDRYLKAAAFYHRDSLADYARYCMTVMAEKAEVGRAKPA